MLKTGILLVNIGEECSIYRGSYMSDHVLLDLLNESFENDKTRLAEFLSFSKDEFNKSNKT